MAETPLRHTDVDVPRSLLAAEFDSFRFRIKLGEVGRRLFLALAILLVTALVVIIADHTVGGGLPIPLIRALGGVLGVIAGGLLAWAALVGLRRLNPVFVARWLERTRGVANNVVVNWLLVQRDRAGGYASDAAVAQAARELESPSGQVEAVRGSNRPLVLLGAVVGAWVLFAIMSPKPILTSIERLFGAAIDAPSATRIRLISPAAGQSLHVGESATLLFGIDGRSAGPLTFELLADERPDAAVLLSRAGSPDQSAEAALLAPGAGDLRRVLLAANEVGGRFVYRVRAGDAVLRGTIPVLPRPDVVSMRTRLKPPAYVGQPESIAESPDITAWAGTLATFEFQANTEIRGPVLVLRGETELRTRMSVNGARDGADSTMLLTESGDYWLEFSDATGRPYPDPPPHRITVRTDQPPTITLTEPQVDALEVEPRPVDVTRFAWLKAAASDDVRLAAVAIVIERTGRVPERRELLAGAAPAADEVVTVGIATSDIELKPGETAKVWFEARDGRRLFDDSPAPQTSATVPIVITRPRLAPPIIKPTEKVAPPNGEPGEAAAVGQRPQGQGEGDDGTSAGDGSGDRPGAGGEESGSYSDSPDGKPADTGEGGIPDPSANGDEAEEQSGKPNAARGGDMVGGENENSEGGLGDGKGEGGGEGSGGGEQPSFEDELKRFVEKHGEAAKEAGEAIDRSTDRQESETDEPPPAAEPSDKPLPENAPKPEEPATAPESQPADPSNGFTDERQPDSAPSEQPQAEKRRQDETKRPPAQSQPSPPNDGPPSADGEKPQEEREAEESPERSPDPKGQQKPDEPESADSKNGESKPAETPAAEPEIAPSPEGKIEGENPPAPEPELPKVNDPGARSASPDAPEMPGGTPSPAETPAPDDGTERPGAKPAEHPKSTADGAPGDAAPRSELVNTLDLLERAETLDEESLHDLPWPIEKKRAFLAELKRLAASAKRSGVINDLKRWRSRAALGERGVQRGSGLDGRVNVDAGEAALEKDLLERAAAPPDQKISPGLRAALDAYYRSLAARNTTDPSR